MISHHDIRQTAVQFLYGVGIQSTDEGNPESFDFSSWDIVLEPAQADLAKSRAKAVEHLTRDRADKVRVFRTRSEAAIAAMKDDLATSDLRDALEDLLKREHSLDETIKMVRNAAKKADRGNFAALEDAFAPLFLTNETLLQLRSRFLTMIQDHPGYMGVLAPLSASLNRVQEISERLRDVQHPGKAIRKSEIAKLVEGTGDMEEIRVETEKLVRGVLSQLKDLDGAIAQVTDNFSPARVSLVDRAILRIATYELKNCPDLPVPVIIKEAIILAEEYSVNEATKFVNGVLAGVASLYRPKV